MEQLRLLLLTFALRALLSPRVPQERAGTGSVGWEQQRPPALRRPGTEVFPSHQKTLLLVSTERRAGRIMSPRQVYASLSSPSSQAEPSAAYS